MMKVKKMVMNGKEINNQYILNDEEKNIVLFQSYESPIVSIDYNNKIITVYPNYNYSKTTAKYRNHFMYCQFFGDMQTTKGFEYYMNLGAIGDYEIIKA